MDLSVTADSIPVGITTTTSLAIGPQTFVQIWIPFPSPPNSEYEFGLHTENEEGFPLYEDEIMPEERLPSVTIAASIGYQRLIAARAARDAARRASAAKTKSKKQKRGEELRADQSGAAYGAFKRPSGQESEWES